MSAENELPASWATARLDEVCTINGRGFTPFVSGDDQPVAFVPMAAVVEEFGGIDVSATRPLGEVTKGYTAFVEGDVLFAKITPCMENGKVAVVPPLSTHIGFGSTEFHVLRSAGAVEPKWVGYHLSQLQFRRAARQDMTGSAGQLRVQSSWLAGACIPVAPIAEQRRAIQRIDELLSDLDAGVLELVTAKRKLSQYRQSLLKAAVEGALTAEWRARNPPQETGTELLARILRERRARWELRQLEKFAAQGKAPPKDWKQKYPEPASPSSDGPESNSEGWAWATLDQLSEFVTSGSRGWAEFYASEGATFIRSQNINTDSLKLLDVAFVNPPTGSEGARTRVQRDDLLLTITGANVGKSALVDTDIAESYVSQHVALIRPVDCAYSRYLHAYLVAEAGGRGLLNRLAYGAGKPGLNLEQVAAVAVPLPSAAELPALMSELSAQLDRLNELESEIQLLCRTAAAQRQNILRAAFAGQLVPQDPADEPASALLARIRAERAQRPAAAKRMRRSSPQPATP